MKLQITLEDIEDGNNCSFTVQALDNDLRPDQPMTAAALAVTGLKFLFETGDAYYAGHQFIDMVNEGKNMDDVIAFHQRAVEQQLHKFFAEKGAKEEASSDGESAT